MADRDPMRSDQTMDNPYDSPTRARVCYCVTQEYLCADWCLGDEPGFQFVGQRLEHHFGRPHDVLEFAHADGRIARLHFDIGHLFGRARGRYPRRGNDLPDSTATHSLEQLLMQVDLNWWRARLAPALSRRFEEALARPLYIDPRPSRDRMPVFRTYPPAGRGIGGRYVLAPLLEAERPSEAPQLHGYDRWSMHAFRALLDEILPAVAARPTLPRRPRPCKDGPPAAHFLNEYLVPYMPEDSPALRAPETLRALLGFAYATGRFRRDEVLATLDSARLGAVERAAITTLVRETDDEARLRPACPA